MNPDLKWALVFVFVILASWVMGFFSGRLSGARRSNKLLEKSFIDFADLVRSDTATRLSRPHAGQANRPHPCPLPQEREKRGRL